MPLSVWTQEEPDIDVGVIIVAPQCLSEKTKGADKKYVLAPRGHAQKVCGVQLTCNWSVDLSRSGTCLLSECREL